MRISVLTIAPQEFEGFLSAHIIKRAIEMKALQIDIVDIRDYADGSFRHIDDNPYGGGGGMILKCEPVLKCLDAVKNASSSDSISIAMTPRGQMFSQDMAKELSGQSHLIIICGHFEGMDERIYHHVDREVSIGDYILTGGELPAQVVINTIARLLPGVLRAGRAGDESFENGMLEYPQYTKPEIYAGERVPVVLLSGDHEAVRRWREQEAEKLTKSHRPDLILD